MLRGIIAMCAFALFSFTEASQPLHLAVYYESYCPDSIRFETEKLYPLMQNNNFSLNINLQLVPFGKSSYTKTGEDYQFTCHHGEKECYGNKVQSCALKHLTSKKEQLDFINCVMKEILDNPNATYPTKKCGDHIQGIDQVESCANGPEGNQLLAENGNITKELSPALKSVPTVVVDHTERVDTNINLKALVCKHLSSLKLSECAGTSGSSTPLLSGFLAFATTALLLVMTRA